MAAGYRPIEDRLDALAVRLRREGVIHGAERDLMVDAADLIRDLREQRDNAYNGGIG